MKNKKPVLILVLVLLLLAAAFFVWKQCSGQEDSVAQSERESPEENKKAAMDANGEDAEQKPQLVESEGDLIITIPDDEESDGF